jgi:outer membrane receptor protein involved in Fe transport
MKRIILLFTIFCTALSARAQFGGGGSSVTGKISGTVIDSITKKPMDYATISLFTSGHKVPITGVVTDDKGNFKFNNLAPGKYKISLSFIGYPAKIIDPVITTPAKPDNNMGAILLAPSAKALKEVVVSGNPANQVIENRIDKLVYNAEKDLTSVGGNASDILRKVPMVAVDINGNISLRGDQNVRVLINGKPSGALSSNMADVLRTIPADQIKNIEVITSPSAKYDAEGSGGIINIVTKQKNVSGFSGSVSGGVGTRQNNGNANLNYKQNRFSITGNLGGNYAWPQTSVLDFSTVSPNFTNTQQGNSDTRRKGYIGSVNASYDFNEFNSISSTLRLNGGGMSTNSLLSNFSSALIAPATTPTIVNYNSNNINKGSFSGFDYNADYTHKFNTKGHELVLSGQWSHSNISADYTNYFLGAPNLAKYQNQQGNNNGKNDEYTGQIDYTLPVTTAFKIEAGGKTIQRRLDSHYDIFNQMNNQGDFSVPNAALSNLYNYNQNVYAGYTVLSFTLPKNYGLQVGGRIENTDIKGVPTSQTQALQPFTQNYNTFIPSFVLSKTFNTVNTFKLSYTKRIQRPSLQFLNPFVNQANQNNYTQGNPELAPEVSQTIEFGYFTYIKSSVISISTYYKHTNNLIENIIDTSRTVTLTQYQNIGKNNSWGATFSGSVNPIKILTIRGSINTFTYKPDPTGAFSSQANSDNNKTYFNYNAFLSASVMLKNGFTAESFAVLNSPRRTIQGKNPSFSLLGFGVKKDLMNKKFSVGVNAVSPFQKYLNLVTDVNSPNLTQKNKISYPLRSYGLTFSYNFGKISFKADNPMAPKKNGLNDDLKQGDQNNGQGGGGPQ